MKLSDHRKQKASTKILLYESYQHEKTTTEKGKGGVDERLVLVMSSFLKAYNSLLEDMNETDVDHDTSRQAQR
jgi:hypothetical protein